MFLSPLFLLSFLLILFNQKRYFKILLEENSVCIILPFSNNDVIFYVCTEIIIGVPHNRSSEMINYC